MYTQEQRVDLVKKYVEFHKEMTAKKAAGKAGVNYATLVGWPEYRNRDETTVRKYKKREPLAQNFTPHPQFPFTISGSPQEIAQFISAIARGVQQ